MPLIRNIHTGTIHEVAPGTLYPKASFEEVTKEQLETEKTAAKTEPTPQTPKAPKPALKPKAPAKKAAKKPAKKKTNKK